jgi:hypothetical protein
VAAYAYNTYNIGLADKKIGKLYPRVCKQPPVFNAPVLRWLRFSRIIYSKKSQKNQGLDMQFKQQR